MYSSYLFMKIIFLYTCMHALLYFINCCMEYFYEIRSQLLAIVKCRRHLFSIKKKAFLLEKTINVLWFVINQKDISNVSAVNLNHCFVKVFTDFDKMTITACHCSMLPVHVPPYQLDEIYPTPTIMQRISQSLLFYHLSFNFQRFWKQ